jgi:hypothetical protein
MVKPLRFVLRDDGVGVFDHGERSGLKLDRGEGFFHQRGSISALLTNVLRSNSLRLPLRQSVSNCPARAL